MQKNLPKLFNADLTLFGAALWSPNKWGCKCWIKALNLGKKDEDKSLGFF